MATLFNLDAKVEHKTGAERPRVGKFRKPNPPTFDSEDERARYQKGRLAMAARIFDDQGWGIGCAGGLSARDAINPDLIWVLPRRKPLCAIVSADLVGVNLQGRIVVPSDTLREYDEYVPLHLAIYRGRRDVNGIVSGHTPHGRTFSARGETIRMLWQDSCFFSGRVPVLPFVSGLNAAKDPEGVTSVLGDGKGFIMQNRGLLMTAATIEGAIATYIRLENLCGNQLLVEAAIKGRGGKMIEVGEEEVKFTVQNVGSEHHAWMMGMPYFARWDKRTGGALVI
ncbi:hypothetical protein CcaverHIS002_0105860 [Cutaneotrichosporon cavernicola]|uniref:Class II aldolase/adducin N-terminal domain-containing protein n=1 Tax=Cutaneotrichosporon cavernicola TaxID=279322 RepID=A0AA48L0Q4_9TREE|nr:uncharacterized protein CcaverHIS019_0105800 [Cutaneotrichosporon cavernicola]BEI80057.1 hypothetical protein CcaverHIS002_0105860 [Cutaneotrichosporon cavernicola]BEI87862.1 hypothetical protein CcaverHIS019_0105800 [Cutaneotrichosporon cavernicola]BEI95636.1 hypothetical protein CcaverHIS631_0105850 [Cutaneotrichosporon cavernicola]BEJ03411.1 hypothetical protein CcaverHIS641_0105860 [Cutaneotrichosporon cavernicola]